ncbi:hypothetical protein CCACVL1_15099, partial [Corchorus capsularis]
MVVKGQVELNCEVRLQNMPECLVSACTDRCKLTQGTISEGYCEAGF